MNPAVKCLIGSCIYHLILGTLYLWGNINIYVTSCLRIYTPGLSIDTMAMIFPVMGLMIGLGNIISIKLSEKIGLIRLLYVFISLLDMLNFKFTWFLPLCFCDRLQIIFFNLWSNSRIMQRNSILTSNILLMEIFPKA